MRRPGSSPVKTEGERSSVGQGPPKSCVDVKLERTQDSHEQHSTVEKPTLLGMSPKTLVLTPYFTRDIVARGKSLSTAVADGVSLRFPGGLERVKAELREEVSGHSSVSDMESDSDSPTEVNDVQGFISHFVRRRTSVNTELSSIAITKHKIAVSFTGTAF